MIVFPSNHFHFWICFNVHSIVLILIILVSSWHCIVVLKRCLSAYARGLRIVGLSIIRGYWRYPVQNCPQFVLSI